jgi:hypothetical protein
MNHNHTIMMWFGGLNLFKHLSTCYHGLLLAFTKPSILRKTLTNPPLHLGNFDRELVWTLTLICISHFPLDFSCNAKTHILGIPNHLGLFLIMNSQSLHYKPSNTLTSLSFVPQGHSSPPPLDAVTLFMFFFFTLLF